MSLQDTEAECAANAVAPRVSLHSMETKIARRYDFIMLDALSALQMPVGLPDDPLGLLSVCVITMNNGFTLVGKSAPASAANFNAELGRKLAYEDAIRQLWPLEGYALREKLSGA